MSERSPRPEFPRPNLRRPEWLNLNGEWEFGAGDRPSFQRRIIVPFCPQSELSGIGELPGDVVWYRRRFDAPECECLVLHFGAVDYRATVWVNDVEVARHEGGHTPFSADITHAARPRDNVMVVRAEDPLSDRTIPRGKQYWTPKPEGIFYTSTTGIWQTVWLEPLAARHISRLRLSPDLAAGAVDFELDGQGRADGWEHALSDLCTVHDYEPPAVLAQHYRVLDSALEVGANGHAVFDPGYSYLGEPIACRRSTRSWSGHSRRLRSGGSRPLANGPMRCYVRAAPSARLMGTRRRHVGWGVMESWRQ